MNYKRIYSMIMLSAKSKNRNKKEGVYYESHHVIPDFMFFNRSRKGPHGHLPGSPNDATNKVLLTPREHFLAHLLLYKSLRGLRYEHPAGSALSWFFTKVISKHPRQEAFNIANSKKYAWCRDIGRLSISATRTGTFPAVCVTTGLSVGSVKVNDPRLTSGDIVHHSRGKKQSDKVKNAQSIRMSGAGNGNYKPMTSDMVTRILNILGRSIDLDGIHFVPSIFWNKFHEEFKNDFKKISKKWVGNHLGSHQDLVTLYNQTFGTSLLCLPGKQKALIYRSNYTGGNHWWITNDIETKRIKNTEDIPAGFRRGRGPTLQGKKND